MSDQQGPDTDGVPVIYTNLLRAIPSPFEFALDLGYVAPAEEARSQPPKAEVRIVMSWEYVKLLSDVLAKVVTTREGNTGEIKLPPGVEFVETKVEAGGA